MLANHVKDGVFKVSVQRISETSGCFSGLTLEVKKILFHQYSIPDFESEGKTMVLKELDHDWYEIVGVSEFGVQRTLVSIPSKNQRTNGPVNAHLISWPTKAQNIQNLENIWKK